MQKTVLTNVHRSTISTWAKYGLHGLSIDGKIPEVKISKKKNISIEYNGVIYSSARKLESIPLNDGKCHNHETIISWAKNNKNGLKLL